MSATRSRRREASVLALALIAACGRDTPHAISSQSLAAVTPTELEGRVGAAVEHAPAVLVTDRNGRPQANVIVRFQHHASGSQSAAVLVATDGDGLASIGEWLLPERAGVQLLSATAGSATVWFTATARPDVPARLLPAIPTSQVALVQERRPGPGVIVVDRYGNRVDGVEVAFRVQDGGGSLDGVAARTTRTSDGTAGAGAWIMGDSPGTGRVIASSAGVEPMEFRTQVLDSAAVTWYDLQAVTADGGWEPLPLISGTDARLGMTTFDPCLCIDEAGYFVERGTIVFDNYGRGIVRPLDNGGGFRIVSPGTLEFHELEERVDLGTAREFGYFHQGRVSIWRNLGGGQYVVWDYAIRR